MEAFIVKSIIECNKQKKISEILQDDAMGLPINKIDGIPVNARIHMCLYTQSEYCHQTNNWVDAPQDKWTYYWLLLIDSNTLFDENDEEGEKWRLYSKSTESKLHQSSDIAGLKKDLEELILSTKKLRVNKIDGKLSKDAIIIDKMTECYKLLKNDPEEVEGFELEFKECSVCYDLTQTKTNCHHFVCIKCISQLPYSLTEYDVYSCPMCRRHFNGIY